MIIEVVTKRFQRFIHDNIMIVDKLGDFVNVPPSTIFGKPVGTRHNF